MELRPDLVPELQRIDDRRELDDSESHQAVQAVSDRRFRNAELSGDPRSWAPRALVETLDDADVDGGKQRPGHHVLPLLRIPQR